MAPPQLCTTGLKQEQSRPGLSAAPPWPDRGGLGQAPQGRDGVNALTQDGARGVAPVLSAKAAALSKDGGAARPHPQRHPEASEPLAPYWRPPPRRRHRCAGFRAAVGGSCGPGRAQSAAGRRGRCRHGDGPRSQPRAASGDVGADTWIQDGGGGGGGGGECGAAARVPSGGPGSGGSGTGTARSLTVPRPRELCGTETVIRVRLRPRCLPGWPCGPAGRCRLRRTEGGGRFATGRAGVRCSNPAVRCRPGSGLPWVGRACHPKCSTMADAEPFLPSLLFHPFPPNFVVIF